MQASDFEIAQKSFLACIIEILATTRVGYYEGMDGITHIRCGYKLGSIYISNGADLVRFWGKIGLIF